jgi:hypothetical protein
MNFIVFGLTRPRLEPTIYYDACGLIALTSTSSNVLESRVRGLASAQTKEELIKLRRNDRMP